jgi:hypothetical protein
MEDINAWREKSLTLPFCCKIVIKIDRQIWSIAAGAILTKNVPANSIAYGVNKFKAKDTNYDFVYNLNMIEFEKLIKANNNKKRILSR